MPTIAQNADAARKLVFRPATAEDRDNIYQIRHAVFACEIGQHTTSATGRLSDALDEFNHYLVAADRERIAGFISITPPGQGMYSLDKYLPRDQWPFPADDGLYEVRLLTVTGPYRRSAVAGLLMHAALQWIADRGGTRITAIGRKEVLRMYLKGGLVSLGRQFQSGKVTFEFLAGDVPALLQNLSRFARPLAKLERLVEWQFEFPFIPAFLRAGMTSS